MANVTITSLPTAGPITGTESVPIVQNGQTVQTTTAAIAASPSQNQTFLTINSEATLPNSRYLSTSTGLGLTDGGALSFYRLSLNRASGSLETALTGIVAKDTASTVVARTLQTSGSGLSVSNGDGVSGNPAFSLTGQVASLANASGAGFVALPNNGSVVVRAITGTASEIDVADGTGAAGNPTIGLADNPVLPGTAGVVMPSGNTAARPLSPTNGLFRYNSQTATFEGYVNNAWGAITVDAGVSSVDASGGTTGMSFTGGPITSTGTLTLAGTLGVANGGSGQTTAQAALNTFAGAVTSGQYLRGNGTNVVMSAIQVADVPTLNQNTTGNAATATSLAGGAASQIPYQTAAGATSFIANGTAGQVLTSAGAGVPVWSGISGGTF
jgi:hypothetical protein